MGRLILFVLGVVGVLNLKGYRSLLSDPAFSGNKRFDFAKTKAANLAKRREREEYKKMREKTPQKKVAAQAVSQAPLVELLTAELKRGHKLYKKCVVCHGKRGEGKKSQKSPAVGGQYAWYIEQQIGYMQQGIRVNKVMTPYIKKLTPQDIKDLAAYIAKLPLFGAD